MRHQRDEPEIIDVACEIVRETELAVGVADGTQDFDLGDGMRKLVWLPKSQIEVDEKAGTIAMPEWLAKDKGLI